MRGGLQIPQVLKSCTEFIEKHGVVDGMYRLSGIASNIQKLRHEFDSEQIPDLTKDVYIQDIHCVGSLCKLYFRELPNPLLTYQLYEKFSEAVSAATDEERLIKIHDVIQQLPPPHYRTLEFLMRHLSHLATFSYVTNMHIKNLAIVWAPNLLRSKQIESACFSGTAAFMEVRIQSVVVEFILNHVDVLFSPKLSSLIREGAGHNSLSRPKSLLVSSPSTKLLTLEEAQARTQAQINSPVTADSKYIEVGEGPAALQGKFHTVIEFPTERKRPPIKSKKSPVGSWRSFFSLGKSSSMAKRKLQRNPSEPNELKAMALAGGRGDTGTLRSAKSEESLTSLHNVEGESKVYRPRRPRSSSDALSASFNGDLLDGRHHCNSYDNLGQGDSDGDEGPICVPALISPPRSAEDMDLSPPDIGVASLDFDPMSFQCSLPLGEPSFPSPELGGEAGGLRTSPGASFSEPVSPSPEKALSPFLASPDFSPALGGQAESKKHATATLAEKVVQAFSPKTSQKSIKLPSLAVSEPAVASTPNQTPETDGPQPPSPAQAPQGSLVPPPNMIAMLLKTNEAAPSEGTLLELPGKVPENRDHTIKECTEASGPTGPVLPPTQQGLGTAGAVGMDSSQAPAPVSSVSLLPPPPPPKNAARILALALAESAQQASFFTQRRPSGPPTPMSPLDTLEWPPPPPLPPPATPELVTDRDASPMPAFSSPPSAASPAESRALVASSHLTKSNSTWPPAASNANQDSAPVDTSDSLTESVKGTSPATPQPPQISLSQKSPERQQPALGQVPVTSYSSTTTSSTSISPSTTTTSTTTTNNDLGAMPHMETRVGVDITLSIPKPAEQSTTTVQPPANTWTSAVPTTPTEQADKPWEAQKAAHPRTDPVPVYQAYGPTPPTPPVRSIESKLAAAALSNTEAANASNFHTILAEAAIPSSVEEALPQPPRPPRKPSVLQPAYMYHPKAESTLEAAAEAYYHQRVMPVGQPSMAYHYRPDSVPPHLSYASKSEPQIIYSARSDGRYNTIGPRSFHQSIKSRGPHRGEYIPGGSSGHRSQGYGPMDSAMVYPTIRRVHSLHVPPTAIRSVPITRTEVPPDDELYYYQRPIYQCKPYQQPVQSDYHVTQLQPYFENGRVQYRYSPYSSTSPLDAPYYDVDPYGTIRLRHFHSFSSRDLAPPLNRAGAKAGNYHYLSRHVLPSGREHSFVSRDMPPSHSSKGASVYLAMDPEESERLRMHSVRRENRARQKAKGPVMSQYDNVSPFIPGDPGGMEVLHLRSKSDPGKTVLMTAEGKDGRYGVMPASQHPPRHLLSDPDVFMYMETEKHYQGNGMADKPAVPLKPSGSHSNQTGYHHPQHPHQPPPQPAPRNLPPHQEPSRPDSKGDPGDSKQGSGGSRHWPECPEPRGHPSRYERSDQDRHAIRIAPVSTASYPEEEPQVAPVKPVPPPKPERSHSMRERHHYHQPNPSTIHLQENPEREHCGSYSYQSHGQRHSTMTMLSHYDNLDDYHPVSQTQSQTPVSSRGGTAPYATPGFTTPQSARAYSTALGQGAFLPAELSLQRPETEIHAE